MGRGHITRVDATISTSDPNIYTVGDAVEIKDFVTGFPTSVALAGPADKNREELRLTTLWDDDHYIPVLWRHSIMKTLQSGHCSDGASEKTLVKKQSLPGQLTHSGSHASSIPKGRPDGD